MRELREATFDAAIVLFCPSVSEYEVDCGVLFGGYHLQVFDAVVVLDAIDVVNLLIGPKVTAKMPLHHYSMLGLMAMRS